MEKSYVTLEKKVCACCSKEYDTGSLLLDRRLRKSFDMYTVTGIGLCSTCWKDGYVLLIECDPDKSTIKDGKTHPNDAYRTGITIHIKLEAFKRVFKDACGKDDKPPMFLYIGPDVTAILKKMMPKEF